MTILPFVRNTVGMPTEDALNKFKRYLGEKHLRVTKQRLTVFDAAMAQTEHFTAEQLLSIARGIDPSVSRATVYRTLPIMIEGALLREVDIGKNTKYYNPIPSDAQAQVAQVICANCDKIFEISAPFMEWYGSTVSSRLDLTPVSQRLQVMAKCNKLARGESCPNKK